MKMKTTPVIWFHTSEMESWVKTAKLSGLSVSELCFVGEATPGSRRSPLACPHARSPYADPVLLQLRMQFLEGA